MNLPAITTCHNSPRNEAIRKVQPCPKSVSSGHSLSHPLATPHRVRCCGLSRNCVAF